MVSYSPNQDKGILLVQPDLARLFIRQGEEKDDCLRLPATVIQKWLIDHGHSPNVIDSYCDGLNVYQDGGSIAMQKKVARDWCKLAIALSGGGFRATLFELGILLYLSHARELPNVSGVTSVSGGSILAAHLALNWTEMSSSITGFENSGKDLIKFIRSNVRDKVIVKCLWCHFPALLAFFIKSCEVTHFLRRQYEDLFKKKTLNDIKNTGKSPLFAIVATDIKAGYRVTFTQSTIERHDDSGKLINQPIFAGATSISVAVASSSCFPPVFKRLKLNHRDLAVNWEECKDTLYLMDGGVSGNLGVEALKRLIDERRILATRTLICDSEIPDADEPGEGNIRAVSVQSRFLSAASRALVGQLPNASLLMLKKRLAGDFALEPNLFTYVSAFRTDLDRPTWNECYALIFHGACVAAANLSHAVLREPPFDEVITSIKQLLIGAGASADVGQLTEKSLRNCRDRSYYWAGINFLLALLLTGLVWLGVFQSVSHWMSWDARPLTAIWRTVWPPHPTEVDANCLLDDVASGVCQGDLDRVKAKYVGKGFVRLDLEASPDSSGRVLYMRKSIMPTGCNRSIDCEISCRGTFASSAVAGRQSVVAGRQSVAVIGLITSISMNSQNANGYVVISNCYLDKSE